MDYLFRGRRVRKAPSAGERALVWTLVIASGHIPLRTGRGTCNRDLCGSLRLPHFKLAPQSHVRGHASDLDFDAGGTDVVWCVGLTCRGREPGERGAWLYLSDLGWASGFPHRPTGRGTEY